MTALIVPGEATAPERLVRVPARLAPEGARRDPGYRFHVSTLTEEQTKRHLSFRARTELLGPDALRRFAGRFEADLLALAEAGR